MRSVAALCPRSPSASCRSPKPRGGSAWPARPCCTRSSAASSKRSRSPPGGARGFGFRYPARALDYLRNDRGKEGSVNQDPAGGRRTTHVVDRLPERVRLVDAPGGLRGVELGVLGWRNEEGETALVCRLVDGSAGTIPARWTDLPRRVAPEPALGGLGSPAAWRLLREWAE